MEPKQKTSLLSNNKIGSGIGRFSVLPKIEHINSLIISIGFKYLAITGYSSSSQQATHLKEPFIPSPIGYESLMILPILTMLSVIKYYSLCC